MAAPLYFLPNCSKDAVAPAGNLNHKLLAERGLGHVFGEPGSTVRLKGLTVDTACSQLAGRGPGNLSGVILCALPTSGQAPRRIGYYPAEQKWVPWLDGSQVWIGWDPSEPPGPEDLARRERFPGHAVELADGNSYEIPVVRSPVTGRGTSLPCTMGWDSAGAFEVRIKAEYRTAWDESERSATLFYGGVADPGWRRIDYEEALRMCLRALSLNYRLGRLEQNAFGLVDTETCQRILGATVDWPTVEREMELSKKNGGSPATPDSPNSTPGDEDSADSTPESTDRAEANCSSPG